jgi:hypothetical protein
MNKKPSPAEDRVVANSIPRAGRCATGRLTLRPGLERDTQLMPWLLAETVCAEASQFLDVDLPARYAAWLEAKAELCYSGDRHFSKLMRGRGNAPREWLCAFMRHWLASFLHLERPDLYKRLPISFANGKRLPLDAHPLKNGADSIRGFLFSPRGWEESRVTRHFRWAWLKELGESENSVRYETRI